MPRRRPRSVIRAAAASDRPFRAAAPAPSERASAAALRDEHRLYPSRDGGDEDLRRNAPSADERVRDYGGVDKKKFERTRRASIVGKCHLREAHYALLKKEGLTTQQLRDIGRIAAVVIAAAQAIAAG